MDIYLFILLVFMFITLSIKFLRMALEKPSWKCSKLKYKLSWLFFWSAVTFGFAIYRHYVSFDLYGEVIGSTMIFALTPFYFEAH